MRTSTFRSFHTAVFLIAFIMTTALWGSNRVFGFGTISGPDTLEPGETADYSNSNGEYVEFTMPDSADGVFLVTVGNATKSVYSTSSETGYWKGIDYLQSDLGSGSACNNGCDPDNENIEPGGSTWWMSEVGEIIKGHFKVTGRTAYYVYFGVRCTESNFEAPNMYPTFGLPLAGNDTHDVCDKPVTGIPCSQHANFYVWEGVYIENNFGCPINTSAGNPINFATGNKFQIEEDLPSGASPMSLSFKRYYNSQSQMARSLGIGWRHTYSRSLSYMAAIEDIAPGSTLIGDNTLAEQIVEILPARIFAWRADGKPIYFEEKDGGFSVEQGGTEELIQNDDDTYSLLFKDGGKEHYDTEGKLTAIEDKNGNTQTLMYDDDNELVQVIDPFGRILEFEYDESGRIDTVTDPSGNVLYYEYDDNDNLSGVTYPDGNSRIYHYEDTNDVNNLTGITNQNGVRYATYEYDEYDRAVRSVHADSMDDISVSYYSNYQRIVTDGEGNVTTYTMEVINGKGVATRVSGDGCQSCGTSGIAKYKYDDNLNLTETTDKNGIVTEYTYDSDGNMLTKTEAKDSSEERTTTYTYVSGTSFISTKSRESVVSGNDAVMEYTYDDNGNLIEETESGYSRGESFSYTTSYEYNSIGQITLVNGPRDDVQDTTVLAYDSMGNLVSKTEGEILTTSYEDHNSYGSPGKITDPNGNISYIAYDYWGRAVEMEDDSGTTQNEYDGEGNLLSASYPNGNVAVYTYSDANRLVNAVDINGNKIAYEYNDMGNETFELLYDATEDLKKYTEFEYDAAGRVVSKIYPDESYDQFTYDGNGNLKSFRNANAKTIYYQYDDLNRLTSVTKPASGITSYAYDVAGNLIAVNDAEDNTTSYEYDDAGRLIEETSPDTGTAVYGFDEAGNLLSKTDANDVTINYTYDALNRLISIQYADSDEDVYFTYDEGDNGKGHLTSVSDPSGSVSYTYSPLGWLLSEEKTIEGIPYSIDYSYDQSGNLAGIVYPDGRTVAYELDESGTPISVQTTKDGVTRILADGLEYLPFGPLEAMTYENGVIVQKTFDQQYRQTALSAGQYLDYVYDLDNIGNILSIDNQLDDTRDQSFSYDAASRLISAEGVYGTIDYTYDNVGNRLTRTQTGDSAVEDAYYYFEDTNRLRLIVGDNAELFQYDSNGNIVQRTSVAGNSKPELDDPVDYIYNNTGQRIIKDATTDVIYHYDLSGHLIAETDTSGTLVKAYIWFNSEPLAMIDSDESVYYFHNDHLGTPQKLTDEDGDIVWAADYLPFGQADVTIETVENNLRYAGQYYDSETGLHYNGFRYYDPGLGRYLRADPIGLLGGVNLYAYVQNDPVNFVDPYGLQSLDSPSVAFRNAVLSGNIPEAKLIAGAMGLTFAEAILKNQLDGPDDPTDPQQWLDWPEKKEGQTACETRQPDNEQPPGYDPEDPPPDPKAPWWKKVSKIIMNAIRAANP